MYQAVAHEKGSNTHRRDTSNLGGQTHVKAAKSLGKIHFLILETNFKIVRLKSADLSVYCVSQKFRSKKNDDALV
jgi:hypothetical protein